MYQVGQVLYIILKKKKAVFPVQVVEQVVRKTLSGEDVTFKVAFPNSEEHVDLRAVAEKEFTSAHELQEFLLSNLSEKISAMVGEAEALASSSFVSHTFDKDPTLPVSSKEDTSTMQITLEDGTKANVTVPNDMH